MFSYVLTPWTFFTDFSFHTMLTHVLRAFFYPAVWLKNLKVSRWSWTCAPNTVRKVGVELTGLRTGSFSTRYGCFQHAEHTRHIVLAEPSGGRQHLCTIRWASSRVQLNWTMSSCLAAETGQDVSKHNLPVNKSVTFCLHSGGIGSRSPQTSADIPLWPATSLLWPIPTSGWDFQHLCVSFCTLWMWGRGCSFGIAH
jgi:hypothetical protein